ncbi:MAG: phosphoribosylglycinamide formyltransferase [Pirellulales bacterium]
MNHPRPLLKVAVLISGGGTTLRNLIRRVDEGKLNVELALVVASRPDAGGLKFAAEAGIPRLVLRQGKLTPDEYSQAIFDACRAAKIDLVVMGGFLKFVPIPADFHLRVINIHPSLIPAFCGHGFYGHHVHEAVLEYGARISGCTVHFVDNQYDHGPIICQRTVAVLDGDTPATLAARVFEQECEALPLAVSWFATGRLQVDGRWVRVLD